MSASKGMRLEAASAERLHLAPGPMRAGTAECRVGVAKIDVSPEGGGKGIHNRSWGAAASDVASGMHKPIYVSAMAVSPVHAAMRCDATTGAPALDPAGPARLPPDVSHGRTPYPSTGVGHWAHR